jgi:hypothetical protein
MPEIGSVTAAMYSFYLKLAQASSKSLDTDGDNRPNCVGTDDDNDNVAVTADNCPSKSNPAWSGFDLDGIGDTCNPQTGAPKNTQQCKKGDWMRFNYLCTFKNQGDCIQFVNLGKYTGFFSL